MDNLLDNTVEYSKEYPDRIPESLRRAICTFYIGSTIKYLQNKETTKPSELVYSFLCHISLKQEQHDKAFDAITSYFQYLKDSLRISSSPETQKDANQFLEFAYDDLKKTSFKPELIPPLVDVIDQLRNFIVGTEIQVLNSIKQKQPNYSRRYNILIGGTKLARGVTIKNLLVTYYGRQTKRANMDTMLQHARMYGYREKDLDVIRLYLTQEIEERFELINESEQALRNIIKEHPNEDYRGILIGNGVNATRSNVLNPFNMGSYAAGAAYFPRRPMFEQAKLGNTVEKINKISDEIYPEGNRSAIEVTIDDLLKILRIIKSAPNSGLWDDRKILMALQTLQKDPVYKNKAFLVVRRNVKRTPREGHKLNAIIAGGELDLAKDNKDFPTLFLYRVDAKKSIGNNGGWDGVPFWVPSLRFPDGNYALIFNLNDEL